MYIKKSQIPILIVLAAALIFFGILFSFKANYEFLMYIGVIVLFFIIILSTNRKLKYDNVLLWGLAIWAILHMSGGGIKIGDKILYKIILIPIIGEPYNILKYDQFVHVVGFGVATMVMYHLIKPLIRGHNSWISVSILVVMAGLGVGALNEIVEFFATVIMPETGVGGYINTSLDLVSDLAGAMIAMGVILVSEKKKKPEKFISN